MKRIKKVLFTLVTIILIIVLSYNAYNFINVKILKNDMTSIFGYSILEVVSGSMEPSIHVGDMIIIDTKDKNYNVKDVVTFYDEHGSFVTHRIISLDGNYMITKGDNNNSEDKMTSTNKIVGKYVTRVPGMGKVIGAFKSPFTMIMILVIGILACVLLSTDSDGNPILDEEEKEYEEFLKNKQKGTSKEEVIKKEESTKKDKIEEIEVELRFTKTAAKQKKITEDTKAEVKKKSLKSTSKKVSSNTPKKVAGKMRKDSSNSQKTSKVDSSKKKKTTTSQTKSPKKTTAKKSVDKTTKTNKKN